MAGRDDPEIRQEARFTLWALRTFNQPGLCEAQRHQLLAHGFDLAGAWHSLPAFLRFSQRLAGFADGEIYWNEPHCCRLSVSELRILQALAQCQCHPHSDELACLGREWIAALSLEGICFPTPAELVEGLAPLENLISFQPGRD